MTINSPNPAEVAAALDELAPGECPEAAIIAAALKERRDRGGISSQTARDLEAVDTSRIPGDVETWELHRLVTLVDWARDCEPETYAERLARLREHSPRGQVNATRCDADDAYRLAWWTSAEMLYEVAAEHAQTTEARDEWLDRARDCRRQAWRDGLLHGDPGPSTLQPQTDWARANALVEQLDKHGNVTATEIMRALGMPRRVWSPQRKGLHALAYAVRYLAGYGVTPHALTVARALPDFMAGVSLQVAAMCGDRELFDRSWAILEKRCREPWTQRRREILTPDECRRMIDAGA